MKKILFAIIAANLALGFTSCTNEESNLFDQSAAERLNEAKEKYTKALASEGGTYVMEYWPTSYVSGPNDRYAVSARGYLMCLEFDINGSVRVGMNNAFTGNKYTEDTSAWEILNDMGAVLSFNTYNKCLHCFSTPEDYVNGVYAGDKGTGVGGDYEFVVVDIAKDGKHITLKGKKNGTYSRLTRLPKGTDFATYLADIKDFVNETLPANMSNYLIMNVGKTTYKSEEWNSTIPNIYTYTSTAELSESRHPYLITKQGENYCLRFRDKVKSADGSAFVTELLYDPTECTFNSYIKGEEGRIAGLSDEDMPELLRVSMNNATKWAFIPNEETMSPALAEIVNRLLEGSSIGTTKYALDAKKGVNFQSSDYGETVDITINLKQGAKSVAFIYVFKGQNTAEGFSYTDTNTSKGTSKTLAERYRKNIAGLDELLNSLSSNFTAARSDKGLNVTQLKMICVENPDVWFTMNM